MKTLQKLIFIFLLSSITAFAAYVDTPKYTFNGGEQITVTFEDMSGDAEDWIGIYPVGTPNDWDSKVDWAWTNGAASGTLTFNSLPNGDYEARAFYANSFNEESTTQFIVRGDGGGGGETSINTSKSTYDAGEQISVTVSGMQGDNEDWVGIYPVGSSNEWINVVSWAWTNGITEGTVSLTGVPAGDYEARAFFANSFNTAAMSAFNVVGIQNQDPILLENAENGISSNWERVLGNYDARLQNNGYQSSHCVKLTTQWRHIGGANYENSSEYKLKLDAQSTHKVLEMDLGGAGPRMPHYFIGVQVMTTQGERSMIWDSFFEHHNVAAFISDYGNGNIELAYPSPVEQVRGWGFADVNVWNHFSVNIENYLQQLEPNNHVLYIDRIKFSGGFLDNITLSN